MVLVEEVGGMTGETKVSPDVDKNTEHKGSATRTPGLTSLDQQREASLADEGGAAGAAVEGEEAAADSGDEDAEDSEPGEIGFEVLVIGAGLLGAALFLLWRGR
jgi:hypothetical protein